MENERTPSTRGRRTDYGHTERFDLNCTHTLYGLTCEAYDALRDRADDACEICRTPDHQTTRGKLVIDHFQGAGLFFVRGLLCDKCNSVMSRHDRTAPWGPASLPFKDKARAYHLAAWDKPTAEEFALADEYIQSHGVYSPIGFPAAARPKVHIRTGKPYVRLDQGTTRIAQKLRKYLSPEQLARVIALLAADDV